MWLGSMKGMCLGTSTRWACLVPCWCQDGYQVPPQHHTNIKYNSLVICIFVSSFNSFFQCSYYNSTIIDKCKIYTIINCLTTLFIFEFRQFNSNDIIFSIYKKCPVSLGHTHCFTRDQFIFKSFWGHYLNMGW